MSKIYNLYGEFWDYGPPDYISSYSTYEKAKEARKRQDQDSYYYYMILPAQIDSDEKVKLLEHELAYEEGWLHCRTSKEPNQCKPSNPAYQEDYDRGYNECLEHKMRKYE